MKVLWFAPHFRKGVEVGSLRTWALAKHLVERGHEVTVITPGRDPFTGADLISGHRLSETSSVDGVQLIRVWASRNDRSRLWRRIAYFVTQSLSAAWLALFLPRPDVLLAANYPPTLALGAWGVARLRRFRFLLEVRDLPAEAALASGYVRSRLVGRLALALERFLFRRADHIITVAPGMQRRMEEVGIAAKKISLVPNGYEESLFAEADFTRDVRAEEGWGSHFVVLYTGTLGHVPDIPTLLAAARLLLDRPSFLFAIVGGGQRESEYREICRRDGLHNCRFLGRRRRVEIPPLCRAADVCVNLFPRNPFWGTIFGNKNFDYLGSGTAYVYAGSEPSDTADLLRASGGGIVVEPGDPEALSKALVYLHDRPEERRRMGEAGRRYVIDHYSRSKSADRLEACILEVVQQG